MFEIILSYLYFHELPKMRIVVIDNVKYRKVYNVNQDYAISGLKLVRSHQTTNDISYILHCDMFQIIKERTRAKIRNDKFVFPNWENVNKTNNKTNNNRNNYRSNWNRNNRNNYSK